MKRTTVVSILGVCLSLVPSANGAGVVSWSMDNANTIGGSGTAFNADTVDAGSTGGQTGAGDFAGVVRADWWGNSWNGGGQVLNPQNLIDDEGVASTIDMSSNTGLSYNVGAFGADTGGDWNRTMLSAYVNNESGQPVTLTLSDINATYATYDLYVYFMSDVDSRVGDITVGGTTYFFGANPGSLTDPAQFNLASVTTSAGYDTDANYAKFSGLTADSLTMTANFWTNNTATERSFGGISGFQLVPIPEPSAALLGGLGMLGLLRRRRS